ncbi:hypothetical protein QZH41_008223, partial [Actinostola sp. cb2023]
ANKQVIFYQICSCHSQYYEVRLCRPKLYKVYNLLQECLYRGQEYENSESITTKPKYSFQDLLDVVQGSEKEIQQTLDKLGALVIDGVWRLLDNEYEEKVVVSILTIGRDGLELEKNTLQIIEHCLERYGEQKESQSEVYYTLNEDRICQFYAEYLLRPADRFNYEEFIESWQQSVPDGMTTKSQQLAGLALTDMKSHPPVIFHFPYYNLPEKPDMSFMKLFRTRSKWTFDEIQPYIRDLVESGQSLNVLLLKYARSSKDDTGAKVYSSKKPL